MELKEYRNTLREKDARWKDVAKYRKEAETAELDRELEQVANDIIEAMNGELDTVLDK